MRYLGSKDALVNDIIKLLADKRLLDNRLVFCDAFCGMGAVANAMKMFYKNIIINDSLKCAVTYTKGRLVANYCCFQNLKTDPFTFLNENKDILEGFVYKNYSPGGSKRMYFTSYNAARIDFFRKVIEDWYQTGYINTDEYSYLLACLLESVSSVSNTAGVYGAFLKHWDNRALKEIKFNNLPTNIGEAEVTEYNGQIEDLIKTISCDILYLDPPYTQNQYGTQYHLLETLILNDNPPLSAVTGSRPTTPMRSQWSKKYHSHILLDKVIAETNAKHIIVSYNNDGFMSQDYIASVLKRYGKEETYKFICVDYKKYNNFKCRGGENHKEYLFYIEKKSKDAVVYESPLNYTGSKSKMVGFIKSHLPSKEIKTFVDLFGGGFNVGVNIKADEILYNDINPFVEGIIHSFTSDTYTYLQYIEKMSNYYNLSPCNKDGFLQIRNKYNEMAMDKRDARMLYTLVLYGFQQQIRFNKAWEFNNPPGSRCFNERLLAKFVSFARKLKDMNVLFYNESFDKIDIKLAEDTFIYADPPYRETLGVYNDGKRGFEGWTKSHEKRLCEYLNQADRAKAKFMLSYLIRTNNFQNQEITKWVENNNYKMTIMPIPQGRYCNRQEVIITNY